MVYSIAAASSKKYSFVLQLNISFILRDKIIFESRIACLAKESLTEEDQSDIRFPGLRCAITIQLIYGMHNMWKKPSKCQSDSSLVYSVNEAGSMIKRKSHGRPHAGEQNVEREGVM
jgi:hypothetical protein